MTPQETPERGSDVDDATGGGKLAESASDRQADRCGHVAVIGRTNAGKSTLVNRLVGEKVAIVSPVPQTTRNIIVGIRNEPGMQLILVDTPGFHVPEHELNRRML